MRKSISRFLSIILAAAMVLGSVNVPAFAEEIDIEDTVITDTADVEETFEEDALEEDALEEDALEEEIAVEEVSEEASEEDIALEGESESGDPVNPPGPSGDYPPGTEPAIKGYVWLPGAADYTEDESFLNNFTAVSENIGVVNSIKITASGDVEFIYGLSDYPTDSMYYQKVGDTTDTQMHELIGEVRDLEYIDPDNVGGDPVIFKETVYTLPASANDGHGINLYLKARNNNEDSVKPSITKVTVSGAVTVNGALTITQEVGCKKEYTFTLPKEEMGSLDTLVVAQSEESKAYFNVSIDNDSKKLIIETTKVAANPAAGEFQIMNETKGTVVANVKVATKAPAWVTQIPVAQQITSNDISVTLKLTLPKGITVSDDLYYAISFNQTSKSTMKDGLYLNYNGTSEPVNNKNGNPEKTVEDAAYKPILFEKVTAANDTFKIYPFIGGNSTLHKFDSNERLGEGCATSLNAKVQLIQVTDKDNEPCFYFDNAEGLYENVFNITDASKVKNLSVSTKAPYYEDKIKLKSDKTCTTKIYAGQQNIKIANVIFGKNTTFATNHYWMINTNKYPVRDAKGNAINDVIQRDNDGRSLSDAVSVHKNEEDESDQGLYVNVHPDTPSGKYTIYLTTEPYGNSTAKITISVLPRIHGITVATDNFIIYKKSGSAASYSTKLGIVQDQDYNYVKKPYVEYEVGLLNNDDSIDKVDGIAIAKNGKITIRKDFEVTSEVEASTYAVKVKDAGFKENSYFKLMKFKISKSPVSLKKGNIKLYRKDGDAYTRIDGKKKEQLPFDQKLYFTLQTADGTEYGTEAEPLEFGTCKDENKNRCTEICDGKVRIEFSDIKKTASLKPFSGKITATGIDGSKVSASCNITYESDNDKYVDLQVNYSRIKSLTLTENNNTVTFNDGTYNFTSLPGEYSLYLGKYENESFSYGFNYANNTTNHFVEGTLSVKGAKVLKKYNGGQRLDIKLTGPEATITLKKGKNKLTYKITDETMRLPASPAIKAVGCHKANTPVGKPEKMYSNYNYDSNHKIEVVLKDFIRDKDKKIVPAGNVKVKCIAMLSDGTDTWNPNATYQIVKDSKGKDIPVVYFAYGKTKKADGLYFELEFFEKTGSGGYGKHITRTALIKTVKLGAFKKTFNFNATQTMNYKVDANGNPVSAGAIELGYKGKGVESVNYKNLYSYNTKGNLNHFEEYFKIVEGEKTKLAPETVYGDGQLAYTKTDKKGLAPIYGWIGCEVKYENGETDYVICKTQIKWKKTE